jgi:hypothetical protein
MPPKPKEFERRTTDWTWAAPARVLEGIDPEMQGLLLGENPDEAENNCEGQN